jgi:hypothetical protein
MIQVLVLLERRTRELEVRLDAIEAKVTKLMGNKFA